ncbi:hypothetical protein B5K05_24635 [Rhizobium phaseoli]|uniref:hypothetical protein n=1 Tax=Rhizobium phaseoli TaxID=396 RepID=UPI0003662209|nr:hypothetical protein [Rhizobium phaseoli]KKZ84305.1 hypothetical protein RPHASCH2410_PD05185 [Rhizobium phaseoli Ch24-10]RDJ04361.1 hypothetical protein B5K04_24565 [Rhizobium phaseoli]RDJ06250.1 hypothetical protein B5K05_24635 [Rhizobium phaseoli]
MFNPDLTTTVTAIELLDNETLHVLVTTNDIRDNYVSELRRLTGPRFEAVEVLFRRSEWLTGFTSPSRDLSYIARWDNTIYAVGTQNQTALGRPCEAITRVVGGADGQIFATCYWGLVQWLRNGQWQSIDFGREVDFFHVLPTGIDEFYACGADGSLAHWSNGNIAFIDLPTDATLFALAQDANGKIIVGGEGVLFRGGGSIWDAFDVGETTFHHARRQGSVIILGGGEKGLYRLSGRNLVHVNGDVFAYYVADSGDLIATCGANKVWIIDDRGTYAITFDHLF